MHIAIVRNIDHARHDSVESSADALAAAKANRERRRRSFLIQQFNGGLTVGRWNGVVWTGSLPQLIEAAYPKSYPKQINLDRLIKLAYPESYDDILPVDGPPSTPKIGDVIKRVSIIMRVSLFDIAGAARTPEVVFARQTAMVLAKHFTKRSLPDIGRRMGRDHTTVLHAVKKFAPIIAELRVTLPESALLDDWIRATVSLAGEKLTFNQGRVSA